MKKWKVTLSLLIAILLIGSQTLAASNFSFTTLDLNGKTEKVRTVSVLIDGKTVNSDIPAFIYKDSTLVPIRFVANGLGADVKWNQKNKTVTVADDGKKIVLGIEKPYVYINGQKQSLPKGVPTPKLVNDSRTMVPIRFISETLGYSVAWDNSKSMVFIKGGQEQNDAEINDISINKDEQISVKISSSNAIKYSTMKLENPTRIVIDIPNSRLNLTGSGFDNSGIVNIPVGQTPINQVSASQFSINPNATRVVIHLTNDIKYNISQSNNGKDIDVTFPSMETPSKPIPPKPTPPVESLNKVKDIKNEKYNGKPAVVIYNTDVVKANTFSMSNPNRFVVDILNSTIDLDEQTTYNYNLGIVEKVRAAQFNSDNNYKPDDKIVRVVLDIKDGVSNTNIEVVKDGNKIILIPDENPWEGLNITKDNGNEILTIKALGNTSYDIDYDSAKKVMTIVIPKDKIKLKTGTLNVSSNLIDNITVGEEPKYIKLDVKFRKSVTFKLLSKEIDNEIKLSFARDTDVSENERLIVIDPGHGGKDPGAVHYNINEKNVNFSIANKLNERLELAGFNIIMTRNDDSYLDLYERTDIANDNNADIFISVHSNAHDNVDISGLQTLYHPNKPEGDGSSYYLAKFIQEEVLKSTGFQDKGIIERPGLAVLRTSNMPAALIEVGFLSNEGDKDLITNYEFQDKVVDGIVKGIERYFAEY